MSAWIEIHHSRDVPSLRESGTSRAPPEERPVAGREQKADRAATILGVETVQEQLRRSWVDAEDDLGIEVELLPDAVLVLGFGRPAGMLCAIREDVDGQSELQRQADSFGAGWSALGSSYLKYDRDLFISTLNDWGWHGVGAPPTWYTGTPWS